MLQFVFFLPTILVALVASVSSPTDIVLRPPPSPSLGIYDGWPGTIEERLDLLEHSSIYPCASSDPNDGWIGTQLCWSELVVPLESYVKPTAFYDSDATFVFERILVDASLAKLPTHDAFLVEIGVLLLFITLLVQLNISFLAWIAVLLQVSPSDHQPTGAIEEYIPHRILRRMLHAPTLPCESMVEDMHPPVSSSVGHLMLSGDRLFDLAVNLLVNDDTPAGPLQHIITGAVAALPAITSAAIAAGKLAAGPEPCEASSPIVINHIAKPSAEPDFSAYRVHRPPGVPSIPLYQLTSDFMDDPENLRAPRNTPSAYRPAPGIVDINQIRRDAGRKHTPVPSRTVPRR